MTSAFSEYTRKSFKNRAQLEAQEQCCFYSCESVIDSSKVVSFVDASLTGICPLCGVDALLPGLYTPADLARIHWLFTR